MAKTSITIAQTADTMRVASALTSQGLWRHITDSSLFDDDEDLSEPGEYANSVTLWTSDTTSGSVRKKVIHPDEMYQLACFKFLCKKGLTGTEWIGRARLWGISELWDGSTDYNFFGDYLATLTLTFGPVTTPTAGILPNLSINPYTFCKAIDIEQDRSLFPGMRVIGQENGGGTKPGVPTLILDGAGYLGYVLEMLERDLVRLM